MKTYFFILFTFISTSVFSSESSEILCDLKRKEWGQMSFELRFLTPKRAVALFHFQKEETIGSRSVPVSAIDQSSEASYVGINFFGEEKLVFILLTPIFAPENLGIPMDIEVVSSIYGPQYARCRATK